MDNLKNTKKKLTNIFTIIVFIIVLILWMLFFSWKYLNLLRMEKASFELSVNNTIKRFDTIDKFIRNSDNRQRLLENRVKNLNTPIEIINYTIINKNTKSITTSNTYSDIKDLSSIILDDSIYKLTIKKWFLIRKLEFKEKWNSYFIIYTKKLRYNFENYISDVINFIILMLLLSVLLYYIWYKFINRVLEPIEENIQDMKSFIQNAWHEIKTPMSVIDSNIQLIDETKTYNKDLTKEIRNEIKKMNNLLSGLIELTNISQNTISDNLNLKNEIDEILITYKKNISEKKLEIKNNIPKNTKLKANKQYLYIFFSNLLWNSIKYNKKWWEITISYKNNTIIIKDTWIWIKEENIDKIFDRFYKEDYSRNTEWFWIGLSLVEKIARIYKWKIKIKSEEWKGTSFIVKL